MRTTLTTTSLVLLMACGQPDETATSADTVFGVDLDLGGPGLDGTDPTATPDDEPEDDGTPDLPEGNEVEPGPTIVVLLHGMLTNGGDDGQLSTGRSYWSFEFVRGLLGANGGAVATLAGDEIASQAAWLSSGESVGAITSRSAAHAFVVLPEPRELRRPNRQPIRTVEKPPLLSVMMTARDGSVGLLRQTRDATRQIDTLLDYYEARYDDYFDICNCSPQLVLVGHSMGGLVIRTIAGNQIVSTADPFLNPDSTQFSSSDRTAMDRIRDHTRYAVTLGTPHSGTVFAERGHLLIQAIENLPQATDAAVQLMLSYVGASAPSLSGVADALTNLIVEINPARGAIRDLTSSYVNQANITFLAPQHARRTADADNILGPATGNALIPIYTFGGRSPGSVHFDTFDLLSAFDCFGDERTADQTNILLKMVIDMVMAQFPGGFGAVDGNLTPLAGDVDRVARVQYEPFISDALANFSESLIDQLALIGIATLGTDTPTFVRDLVGIQVPELAADFPIYLTEQWAIEMSGEMELEVPFFQCGSRRLELDELGILGPMSRLAQSHLDEMEDLLADGASLQTAMAVVNGTTTFTANAALILVNALDAYFANARLDPACLLPTGWRIRTETRTFPAPELVPTGEPISDGEVDSDGAVPYPSAMGLFLGTTDAMHYDHATSYSTGCGSWYRRFDSPFETEYHEGLNIRGDFGRYLFDELVTEAGPIAACTGQISVYAP